MVDSDRGQFLRDPINDAGRCSTAKFVHIHFIVAPPSRSIDAHLLLGQPSENLDLCMLSDTVLQEDDAQTFYFETDGLVEFQRGTS